MIKERNYVNKNRISVFAILIFVIFFLSFASSAHEIYSQFSEKYFQINNNVLTISDALIYQNGYYSINGGGWVEFTLTGTQYEDYPFLLNNGQGNLPSELSEQGTHFVIIFSCSLVSGEWDCHGDNPGEGKWQLEIINNQGNNQGSSDWIVPSSSVPLRILFLGNSFTSYIPSLVQEIAANQGWPSPFISSNIVSGQSLNFHRSSSTSLSLVDQGNWDIVVLQDYSTRPTDSSVGDALGFKEDVSWFYDRIKSSSPGSRIVLYETWARHPDHSIYPGTFSDPHSMQEQLRFHYNDAAINYVPSHASFVPSNHIAVAPVGDAWEEHLSGSSSFMLHDGDLYHASNYGRYLNALTLYSTIYHCSPLGVSRLSLPSDNDALRLQTDLDKLVSYPFC